MTNVQRSQGTFYAITMAVRDDCLGSTTDTEDSVALWWELKARYRISVESTIDIFLADYHLVSMQKEELVTQYPNMDRLMDKRIYAVGKIFDDKDKIETILRILRQSSSTTRDLSQEFKKRHVKVVSILVFKVAKMNSVEKKHIPKLPNPTKTYNFKDNIPNGDFIVS